MMHEIERKSFIIRKAESERRDFWKILKSKKVLAKVSGITIPNWESYFGGLFKAEGEISDELLDEQILGNLDYCFSNWKCTGHLNDPITLEEITEEASKLKAANAAGPDGITNTSIKLGFQSMQRYVFHLLNLCFEGHIVSRIWKVSYIKPLYKGKGRRTEPNYYRGISRSSCTYKLFTGIIYQCLRIWVERNQVLPTSQNGFRHKLSIIDNRRSFALEKSNQA